MGNSATVKAVQNGDRPPLTPKAVKWCQEYAKLNSSVLKAWRIAYPNSKASDNSIYQSTRHMLKDPRIIKLLDTIMRKSMNKAQITVERIDQAYADIAFATIGDIAEWKTTKGKATLKIKDSNTLPERVLYAISEVSMESNGLKVKMTDKLKALKMIARRFDKYHERAHLLQSYQVPKEEPLSDEEVQRLKREFDEKY